MIDPALALQKAIYDALMNDPDVQTIVQGRVYDQVPDDVTFPFIKIGDDNLQSELWMTEAFVSVNSVTESVGLPAVKRLAATVRQALDTIGTDLAMIGFAVCEYDYQDTSYLTDEENGSQLADSGFRYLIQELPELP